MTYSLPFGLKQKPVRHYFNGGSIHFECIEGDLRYTVTITTKKTKSKLHTKWIYSKEQLDKLLSVKSLSELQTIEVVQ